MKNKKTIAARLMLFLTTLAICVLLTGCVTSRGFEGREDIHGLVVDGKNRPVAGFQIKIDKKTYFTNETGLFTIQKIKAGEYRLIGTKAEYFSVDKSITINQKKGLLYIRTTSIKDVLDEAEAYFIEKNWKKAEEILEHTSTGSEAGRGMFAVRFYYAMALFKQQKYHQAAVALDAVPDNYSATRDFKNKTREQLQSREERHETN
jgi:predicted small secreted protein